MSNIYIQEPPTNGKILLKTTVGDIDVELWSKETPKACRNFVQLCKEGYYDGTIFHRVVKGFIVQGGDPSGTGTGGESIYGHPFKDEFHSRLRFNRRGLLAMANAGKDDNSSQFFFTLSATPELQNKHTIFGKVSGETIYNMIKLENALVDHEDRPVYAQKIIKAEILHNPFPDIVPRTVPADQTQVEEKKTKEKKSGVKNFKLLSFGEEAEEDEEEVNEANRKYSGRSKSTHDLLNDPKLSAVPAVESESKKRKEDLEESESSLSGDEDLHDVSSKSSGQIDKIRKKLRTDTGSENSAKIKQVADEPDSEDDDQKDKLKKVDNIKKEIRNLKRELLNEKKQKAERIQQEEENEKIEKRNEDMKHQTLEAYRQEQEKYKQLTEKVPKKGSSREDFTLALLAKFRKKLASAKEKCETEEVESSQTSVEKNEEEQEEGNEEQEESWLTHKLKFESNIPVLAKDASTKNDDWFEIYDPRNPINKRRRETSKNKDKR